MDYRDNEHYEIDPHPRFCLPDGYSYKVWTQEPELRNHLLHPHVSYLCAEYLRRHSDYETSEETNWHRWPASAGHRDYSYTANLFRQLLWTPEAQADLNDEPLQPASLRLSWTQAMDLEYIMLHYIQGLDNALNGEGGSQAEKYAARVDSILTTAPMDTDPERHLYLFRKEKAALREQTIREYTFKFPLEPSGSPDDLEGEARDAYEAWRAFLNDD